MSGPGQALNVIDFGYGEGNPVPIDGVIEIHRIEYILDQAKRKLETIMKRGGHQSLRGRVKCHDLKTKLDDLLDVEIANLAYAFHIWLKFDIYAIPVKKYQNVVQNGFSKEDMDDMWATGYPPEGEHLLKIADREKRLPPELQQLIKTQRYPDAVKAWSLFKERFSDIAKQLVTNASTMIPSPPKGNIEIYKRMTHALNALEAASSHSEKLIAFHVALQTAHGSHKLAQDVYGSGAITVLDKLFNSHDPAWDHDVRTLL